MRHRFAVILEFIDFSFAKRCEMLLAETGAHFININPSVAMQASHVLMKSEEMALLSKGLKSI